MIPYRETIYCLLLLVYSLQPLNAAEVLRIGTWGGPYEVAQDIALFEPFTQSSGIELEKIRYIGGLDVFQEEEQPAVLDMLEEDAMIACEQGQLLKLPEDFMASVQVKVPHDFMAGALSECAIAHITFSSIIAYDERAFPDEKPSRIRDFFDVVKFPGKRALQKDPTALFEWALMAEGVPLSQVYDLLSTERGMRLALKRLDSVREHLIWWSTPAESVELLDNQTVVMSSGYNGRFFDARTRNVPLSLIWDGQIIDRSVWAVPSQQASALPDALEFMRFVTAAKRMGALAELIPYGPTRKSAFGFIGSHPEHGMNMVSQLPTAPRHYESSLIRDTRWYARTTEFRRDNFTRWLQREGLK